MDIVSAENKLVKHITSLHLKKNRDIENEFIIEGLNSVTEALKSDFNIKHILFCPELIDISEINITAISVSKEILAKICDTVTPQGIIAVCDIPSVVLPENASKILFLDRVQDPGNVGTIIRTADALGFDAVVLAKQSADPYSLKVVRSTVGSIFHLPVIYDIDSTDFLNELKDKGYTIYSSTLNDESVYLDDADINSPLVLVIGNEGNGISSDIENLTDCFVKIKMPGDAESLNASIAAGILMYKFSC